MDHVETLNDLVKRAETKLEEACGLLLRAADLPLRARHGASLAGDLVRAGWPENAAQDRAAQLAEQIESAVTEARHARAEIEPLGTTVTNVLADVLGARRL